MNFRQKLLPVHRWTGLTLGLIVMVSAITGSGMAFRKQLDPLVYPRVATTPACHTPLPLDRIAAAARAADQHSKLDYLRILAEPTAPVAARFLNKDTLYFDRCTAREVASQNRYVGFFGTLEWIHRGRWIPVGDYIMGGSAIALLVLLAAFGIYLWWPRGNRKFADGFKVSRRLKGTAFNIGLHRAVGAWVAIPLLISATTGLPNAFAGIHDAIVSLDGGEAKAPVSIVAAGPKSKRLPLAAAWATIKRLTPDPDEVLVHVALSPVAPLEIYIIERGAPHANARTYLFLDAYSGTILRFTRYRDMGIGSKIYFWMLSVHTGEVGGIVGQLLLFLGAIGALVLGYTGLTVYIRRRFKLDRKQAQRRGAVTADMKTKVAG